jgi:biotin transport system substrate-specific component
VALYLVVGTAGAPIFAGRSGGFAAWTGPTAGFLGGFVVAAFVTGWLVKRMRVRGQLTTTGIIGACAIGSLVVLNLIGWGFFSLRLNTSIADTAAFASPVLAGDIIKVFVAGTAAAAVHRAYPGLLGVARSQGDGFAAPASPAVTSAGQPVAS